jgi:hypothetical protein
LVTANSPSVSILSPNGGESWAANGAATITWVASDLDDDILTYRVYYSPDEVNWIPIGTPTNEPNLTIDVSELPGSEGAKVRVIATDGVNTSSDDSDASFTVGSKGPSAMILSPQVEGNFPSTAPLLLQGYAYDLEGGELKGSALTWSSSKDGNLGTGDYVLTYLSQGQHTITLTATDSDGNTATATIEIFSGYETYLPLVRR